MNKRTAVAGVFLSWGIACGVARMIAGTGWLIMQGKLSTAWSLPAGLILVFSNFGAALAYQVTGNEDAPVPFWIGQLAFYGFLFYGICRFRSRRPRAAGTAEGNREE